jgi:hypothetical protein
MQARHAVDIPQNFPQESTGGIVLMAPDLSAVRSL